MRKEIIWKLRKEKRKKGLTEGRREERKDNRKDGGEIEVRKRTET